MFSICSLAEFGVWPIHAAGLRRRPKAEARGWTERSEAACSRMRIGASQERGWSTRAPAIPSRGRSSPSAGRTASGSGLLQLAEKSWCNAVTAIEALERPHFFGEPDLARRAHGALSGASRRSTGRRIRAAFRVDLPWLDGHPVEIGAHHPDAFALAAIRTICRAGVSPRVGDRVFGSCVQLLRQG